jgi:hypothetical protein
MGQRASRVLQQESTRSRRSTTSFGATTIRSIPPEQVNHMWRRLVILLRTFLQFIQVKNFLITMMPMETVNPTEDDDEFEKIDVDMDQPKKEKKSKPWRILEFHGEKYVVGKELKEAKGAKDVKKHTHDPMICQHPSDKMSGRGGRADQKWWSCQACGTRWERIPLSKFETTSQPSCKDLLTFGKHAGKTYDFVYLNHINDCEWILKTAESGDDACAQLVKFARYLATREARSPGDIPAGRMDEEL